MPRRGKHPDPIGVSFGDAVRQARKARGLTLETVAGRIPGKSHRTGEPTRMSSKYLQSIEQGWHVPTIATAKKIADALDVSLADLVRGL